MSVVDSPAPSEGHVVGAPALILRAEGLGVLAAAAWGYGQAGWGWWAFLALLLVPDLSMLGYAGGPRLGAACYNLAHTYLLPLLLLALGPWLPALTPLGLIWAAHVGLDRLLGYGLKYPSGFAATHLGRLRAGGRASR